MNPIKIIAFVGMLCCHNLTRLITYSPFSKMLSLNCYEHEYPDFFSHLQRALFPNRRRSTLIERIAIARAISSPMIQSNDVSSHFKTIKYLYERH